MRGWDFTIPIDSSAPLPIFAQIASAIVADIRRGRLHPGAAMPGTRALARTLGVHRNTVIAAHGELTAEGWITTETGRGTFVARMLPEPRPRRFAPAAHASRTETRQTFELGSGIVVDRCPSNEAGVFNLSGWPDLRLVPTKPLARAWRRAIEARTHAHKTIATVA